MENLKNSKNKFPPDSAGGKMIQNIPLVFAKDSILDVKKILFEKMKELETINYIYVIDEQEKLVGVFSIKEIFQRPEETKVEDIMQTQIVTARPYTDQERVAILALNHNLKAIPVMDKDGRFLGVVPSDVILNILHSENVEDILRFAGIYKRELTPAKVIRAPAGILAKARLPWLILGLFGGILAAQVVNFFESSLKTHFILAAFIPLIVYMADAVGTQTETLFIRSLALDTQLNIKGYLWREIKISFFIALVLGVFLSIVSIFWFRLPYIGLILGISLFLTVIIAILIAVLIPLILQKFKKDPALGSGPFATIITDVASLIIYFTVATLMLRIL